MSVSKLISTLFLSSFCASFSNASQIAEFDADMIKSLGLDPRIAKFFSQSSRFVEGVHRVTLSVNGRSRGYFSANFNYEGELCVNKSLLNYAGLVIPQDTYKFLPGDAFGAEECYDYTRAFPQTEIELKPSLQEVLILVEHDAIRPEKLDAGLFQYGGTAGLLNYEAFTQVSNSAGKDTQFTSANTVLGFNAGDWIVRSHQSYTVQDSSKKIQMLYSYAQKTFAESKLMLQAGQINISDSAVVGIPITGVQLLPESSLKNASSSGVSVEGVTQDSARVEVRQNGALIHYSRVPTGPFKLQNIQLISGTADLDVRVIEDNGEERSFTVAAAALGQVAVTSPGYSIALGKVRTFDSSDLQAPMVITGSGGFVINSNSVISAGLVLAGNKYSAAGITFAKSLGDGTALGISSKFSSAGNEDISGAQVSLSVSPKFSEVILVGLNASLNSIGYRDLSDSLENSNTDYVSRVRDQYGASFGFNAKSFGAFSAGYSFSNKFNADYGENILLSWNKQFENASVGLNYSRSRSMLKPDSGSYITDIDKAIYFTVSLPLGSKQRLNSYANKRNEKNSFGISYSDNSNDFAKYRLTASQNSEKRKQDISASMSFLPRYAQVDLGYAQGGSESSSYNAHIKGGIVLKDYAITLSPYSVGDTFGVIKVGELSGVKIETPSGTVWSDPWGRAVASNLDAFKTSSIAVKTKTLPRNVDIKNGLQELSLSRGAVIELDFLVESQRRILLRVTDIHGELITKGAAVLNANRQYITAVLDDGQVFLSGVPLDQSLVISSDGDNECKLNFDLKNNVDVDVYYEQYDAICINTEFKNNGH